MDKSDAGKDRHGRGARLLQDPVWNKGTAYSEQERDRFGLRGLLPPRIFTQSEQVARVMESIAKKSSDLERYIYLISLQDRNEHLFYRVIMDHIEQMMPIIYTPTVGLACQQFAHIYRRPRGLYVSIEDRGRIDEILGNWPHDDVRVIVVTDGERILGLGDLGVAGMGIPIGKLSLYTACAGIHPTQSLPVTLDVGTNNPGMLSDPLYLGLQRERVRGNEYDAFVDEFIEACRRRFPKVLIQLEDFANINAFRLLEKYRDRTCLFDDDIQGTGSVALAGLYAAARMLKGRLSDQKILFLGAGEAGIGIGDLICAGMVEEGTDLEKARQRCWFMDSRGLIVEGRDHLVDFKLRYAHKHAPVDTLLDAVKVLKPTTLVGVSGQPGTFTKEVIEAMAEINEKPIIFALSNPTSKSECTAAEAYTWSGGRAVFASGSPFDPVQYQGRTLVPGQGNNAYIFPGVGLGVVASGSTRVTDEMFLHAAQELARTVNESEMAQGRLYPSFERIREVSGRIAEAVARIAFERGLTEGKMPDDLPSVIRAHMYDPGYPNLV